MPKLTTHAKPQLLYSQAGQVCKLMFIFLIYQFMFMVSVQEVFSLTFNQSSLVHLSFAPCIFSIRASLISPFLQRNCFTSTVCTVDVFFFLSQTATVMKVILSESRQIRFSVFRLDFHSQFSGSLEGTSCHLFEFCGFRLMTCSSAFYMVSKQVSVLLENSVYLLPEYTACFHLLLFSR